MEKLLAQNNDSSSSTVTGQEEGDAHNLSTESSQVYMMGVIIKINIEV